MIRAAGACLLSVLISMPASAGLPSLTRCWTPDSKAVDERTLSDVLACQKRARERYAEDYAADSGAGLPAHMVEQMGETQRSEVREFLQTYPDRAAVAYEEPAAGQDPKEGEGSGGPDASSSGLLDYFAGLLGMAKEKIQSYLGESAKPQVPKDPEAAAAMRIMKRGRVNLGKDPAGALKRAVGKYNSDLDQNLDPEMKKFYRKSR